MNGDAPTFVTAPSTVPQDGDRIGPYRLVQELGEGGCAVAYLAEQTEPVKRQVALKIIKPGMDTRAVIARFEAERQMLALMDHPNVAKVFDAGTTASGRPYFVMELIRGAKLTEYCNYVRATIHERVALFIQVCNAIQHAHQQGVIHRDIKPSNVLVASHDSVPIAKVIDFGIAKAVQGSVNIDATCTIFGSFIGTPAYISPEQVDVGRSSVDTRSDIYSLGVVLYELLTGSTPLAASNASFADLGSLRQRIREEEPPSPAEHLRLLGKELIAHALTCGEASGRKLIQRIGGDLDRVVMHCLEKGPSQRYQTVSELALDLQRYLRHEPVSVRPANWAYVVRKFVRRHQIPIAASLVGAIAILSLIAFGITTSIQRERIAAERARGEREDQIAKEVASFLVDLIAVGDPYSRPNERIVEQKQLLDTAASKLKDGLMEYPLERSQLLEAIGRAYRRQDQLERASDYLAEAVRLRAQTPGAPPAATIRGMYELAVVALVKDEPQTAEQIIDEAFKLSDRNGLQNSDAYALLLRSRGNLALHTGRPREARQYLEGALKIELELHGHGHEELVPLLLELANTAYWTDDFAEAERITRQAIAESHSLPVVHPYRIRADIRLGEVLHLENRLSEAAALFAESLPKLVAVLGGNNGELADTFSSFASIRQSQGRFDEALQLARRAVELSTAIAGEEHTMTAYSRTQVGMALLRQGKYTEAEAELRHARATFSRISGSIQHVASAEHFLAEALLGQGSLQEAASLFRTAMEHSEQGKAPKWRVARSANGLGETLYRQGRIEEAESYLTESYRILAVDGGVDLYSRNQARERLTRFYTERHEKDKLQRLMLATKDSAAPAHQ